MKSNGHGSHIQQIIVRVDRDYAKPAQDALNAEIKEKNDKYWDLLWNRRTTTLRKDDEIVFEADMWLDIPSESWRIIWDSSEY